jgi:hypothetical protein
MHRNSTDDRSHGLLLKELEHIQAILGRYDTFFFVSKNVFVAAISTIILYYTREGTNGPKLLALSPFIIIGAFLTEYLFRYFYWSGYILRIRTIRGLLQRPFFSLSKKLSILKEDGPCRERLKEAFQFFDALFYSVFLVVFLIYMSLRWVRFEHVYYSFFILK